MPQAWHAGLPSTTGWGRGPFASAAPGRPRVGNPAARSARLTIRPGGRISRWSRPERPKPGEAASAYGSVNWSTTHSGLPCPSGGYPMGLRQDPNRRLSAAPSVRFAATRRHRTRKHSNDKRALVTHILDDGRSSQARGEAGVRPRRDFYCSMRPNAVAPLKEVTDHCYHQHTVVQDWEILETHGRFSHVPGTAGLLFGIAI